MRKPVTPASIVPMPPGDGDHLQELADQVAHADDSEGDVFVDGDQAGPGHGDRAEQVDECADHAPVAAAENVDSARDARRDDVQAFLEPLSVCAGGETVT